METIIYNLVGALIGLLYCAHFLMWFFILKGYKPFKDAPKSKLYKHTPLFVLSAYALLVAFLFGFDAPLKWCASLMALCLVPIVIANIRCLDLIVWARKENVAVQSKEGRALRGLYRRCRDICWLSLIIYPTSVAFLFCIG